MSDIWDSVNRVPMEPFEGPITQRLSPFAPKTDVLPKTGPSGTMRLPKVRKVPARGQRLIEGTRAVGRAAKRATGGALSGAFVGGLGSMSTLSDSIAPGGIKGVGRYAPELMEELFLFGTKTGGIIGAAAGASMGILNPALRSVAVGTASGAARGVRNVGRKVSRTLRRTPGSRSAPINAVVGGIDNLSPIIQQVDDDVQASIAELVRRTIGLEQARQGSLDDIPTTRLTLGAPMSPAYNVLRNMPIDTPTEPITKPLIVSSGMAGSSIPTSTIPSAAAATGTSGSTGATATISTTPRTPAAVIPTSSTPRVVSGKMSKNTKYALFAGGLLATSVVMGSRNKKENRINQPNQNQQTPYPNSVRNQYMPASI